MNSERIKKKLVLEYLKEGVGCITEYYGGFLAETAGVCLEDQGHSNGTKLKVDGSFEDVFTVYWPTVTDKMRDCYDDRDMATENGAYGIAIALICNLTNYTILQRSRRGTGFDFWIGYPNVNRILPFQDMARLEVSGIRRGSKSDIRSRVRKKNIQTDPTDWLLPGYIVVVEFGTPLAQVEEK